MFHWSKITRLTGEKSVVNCRFSPLFATYREDFGFLSQQTKNRIRKRMASISFPHLPLGADGHQREIEFEGPIFNTFPKLMF